MTSQISKEAAPALHTAYQTSLGTAYAGDSRDLLASLPDGSVNLIMTSPPFALQRKKAHGNESQADYVDWLATFAEAAHRTLADDGSLVLEIGGAYEKGVPVRSIYQFKALIKLCDELGYHLAEEFYWHNPSKLSSPIEWVNKRKIRAKDSVNTIWWLSKTPWPKADVSKVLTPYSERMRSLLKNPGKHFTPMKRPSGHDISASFGKDNGGAIPSNLLSFPNTESNGSYQSACKALGIKAHPSRSPSKLPEFFIKYLTDPGDLVLDIFSGSNTTGDVAEQLDRCWLSCDLDLDYVAASALRFAGKGDQERAYETIRDGGFVDLR